MQRRRLQREGENPVPHYWDHALWVWGQDSMDDFEKLWDRITLDGVVEQITVPFLITHGANDRQIPVADAHRSYEQATASPKRELQDLHRARGRRRARQLRRPAQRRPLHRRLGRRDLRHHHGLTGGDTMRIAPGGARPEGSARFSPDAIARSPCRRGTQLKDPARDISSDIVEGEQSQSVALGRLARVRVRPTIDHHISVGRARRAAGPRLGLRDVAASPRRAGGWAEVGAVT